MVKSWLVHDQTVHDLGVLQIRSPRIHFTLISLDIKKLHELTITDPTSSSSKPSSYSSKLSSTYATNDDELPAEKVSQKLVKEMSETIDEAKLRKVVDEMLRQRCTSGDEHQYHIDQMQNFLKNDIVKNDIVRESRREILTSLFPQKPTPVVQSCQRDPKAPALILVNQDLLYLKKGNSGSEKFVLYLHKFLAVISPDDDIEERTSRWIVQVIKTYSELGHEHKFVTEIIVRRANGSIALITKPDYKNLNKNDIEYMYLLCVNGKLGVKSYQQKVNITAPTITFSSIEKHKMFSIIFEPIYGIIYKNNKKEKRVMRHQEIHKFCDATLKRVLEGLKSYNNDVKPGYVTPSLSKEDVEYLQLFEEEIKERLKHHDQMRRWEIYIEMCTGMFKDQDEVVVAQEEVQEKVDLVENEEEELIEEEE
ncbi:hypothetical protein Tco_0179767 [Tanacetum coccineum]